MTCFMGRQARVQVYVEADMGALGLPASWVHKGGVYMYICICA